MNTSSRVTEAEGGTGANPDLGCFRQRQSEISLMWKARETVAGMGLQKTQEV